MPNSNLILRTLTSPYGDTTLGSVLSHADVDNNFIYLKSKDINGAQLNGNTLNLIRIDGTTIGVDLGILSSGATSIVSGVYNPSTGIVTFINSTGGTFQVSGFFKPSDDIYVTGLTFNLGTYDLTVKRNDGNDFTQSLGILSSDMTITGGTYNPSNGVATFTNNSGGTFNVSGFLTGYTDTNIYNANGTLTGNRTVTLSGYTLDFTEDILVDSVRVGLGNNRISTNTVLGRSNLNANVNGYHNVAVGYNSMRFNTSGYTNTAVGSLSLYNNTSGRENISIGYQSLNNNTSGRANTSIGFQSLFSNNADFNIGIGAQALQFNTSGTNNIAIGLQASVYNTNGNNLISIGNQALYYNTGGTSNIAIGYRAFWSSLNNINNIAIGDESLINVSGNSNTSIGRLSGYNSLSGSGNVFLGYQAGYSELESNKLHIANNSGSTLIYGEFNNQRVGINTTTPTSALHVSATTDPVRFENISGITSDSFVITSNSNGTLRRLGGDVANRIPFFNSSSAITTFSGFTYSVSSGVISGAVGLLSLPSWSLGGPLQGSRINLNGNRGQIWSEGQNASLTFYVGNGNFGGVLIDTSKSFVFTNNGRNLLTISAEGPSTLPANCHMISTFNTGIVLTPTTTNALRGFWGTNGTLLNINGGTFSDTATTASTASDIAFTTFGVSTLSGTTTGTTYNGISTVYITNAPTRAGNISGNTYALKVANGTTSLGGKTVLNGELVIQSGTNKTVSVVTLTSGTATVINSLVNANSIIMLTKQTNTTNASVAVSAKSTGSFTITSTSGSDADDVAYMIINTIE